MDKKQKELDEMMYKLQQEKKMLAKAKQPNQLEISDAPKKIKVVKKEPSII